MVSDFPSSGFVSDLFSGFSVSGLVSGFCSGFVSDNFNVSSFNLTPKLTSLFISSIYVFTCISESKLGTSNLIVLILLLLLFVATGKAEAKYFPLLLLSVLILTGLPSTNTTKFLAYFSLDSFKTINIFLS